jgi:dipeptidase E
MKTGTMFLSGGGDIHQTHEIDKKYFTLLGNNARILYIPLAMEMTMMRAESCYAWFSDLLATHDDGSKEIDFTMMTEQNNSIDLSHFDSVYIGGGNTYKLLDFISKSGLIDRIQTFVTNGGAVYGGSAGAMILGKDIDAVDFENDKNYPYHFGLNLLQGKSISCHYESNHDTKLLELSKKIDSEIIALPENAGLIIDHLGNIKEIVGKVYSFAGSKKLL